MNFIIGSANSAKIRATENVVSHYYPKAKISSAAVGSGVSNQPFGDDETRLGAINRAFKASSLNNDAIGIGLEGGVRTLDERLFICNWGALILPDGTRFTAAGAQIHLPEVIARKIRTGNELGPVIEEYYGAKGQRHKEGAMGLLTNGTVNRDELFSHILHLLIGQWQYSLNQED